MNSKKVGFFALMAVAIAGFITPTVASAQERCDYHRYYVPARVIRHDRYVARDAKSFGGVNGGNGALTGASIAK